MKPTFEQQAHKRLIVYTKPNADNSLKQIRIEMDLGPIFETQAGLVYI